MDICSSDIYSNNLLKFYSLITMESEKVSDQQLMQTAKAGIQKIQEIQKNPNWAQFSDKPCLMLKMQIDGRIASRGEAVVNFPIDEVFEYLTKEESLQQLNRDLLEIKVLYQLKEFEGETAPRVNYMRYHAPWPVSQRDLVNVASTKKEGDIYYIATLECNYPFPPQKKLVRAKCYIGGYILKKIDENSTLVIYISDVDVAGMLPGMVKNQLSLSQATIASRVESKMKKAKETNAISQ